MCVCVYEYVHACNMNMGEYTPPGKAYEIRHIVREDQRHRNSEKKRGKCALPRGKNAVVVTDSTKKGLMGHASLER